MRGIRSVSVTTRNRARVRSSGPMEDRIGRAAVTLGLALLLGACSGGWEPAFDATDAGWLLNAWGWDRDGILAVGGTPDEGRIYRWDGDEWRRQDLGLDVPLLNWAYGFGADDVTVVGNEGTILRWDGAAWSAQDSTTVEDLWGVWGAGPDDLWAVGGSGFPDATATILHYDGSSWSAQALPALEREVHGFFKVWGSGPDDVYAVGQAGVVLRWDGSTWTELFVGATDDLVSIWGTGPDRIIAVGGRSNGIAARWDGSEWTSQNLAPVPGLNGIWMAPDGTVHVNGTRGTLGTIDFDTFEVTEASIGGSDSFHAIFGVGGRLVSVGGNLETGSAVGRYEGLAWWREAATE